MTGLGRRRLQLLLLVTVLGLAVVMLAGPVAGYLAGAEAKVLGRLDRLNEANGRLERQRERLSDPAEIQRIARRDYGLVGVGEESYTVLPPATAGLALPRAWPFDRLDGAIAAASAGG